jgi:Raf kinase inhibitor-like YbhB/YbcL family protein
MSNLSRQFEPSKAIDYKVLNVSSPSFEAGHMIPIEYTCDGRNTNPPLEIEHIPHEARSLAIIMDDPDARYNPFVHWVIWNIPVTKHIHEGFNHGINGINDFGRTRYEGPCPPTGIHKYYIKVYALNGILDLPPGSSKKQLEKAMSDQIIAFGELTGQYQRKNSK